MTSTLSSSEFSELGDDVHAHSLIQAAETAQSLAIGTPVEANDGLRGDNPRVQELHRADDAHRNVVLRIGAGSGIGLGTAFGLSFLSERGESGAGIAGTKAIEDRDMMSIEVSDAQDYACMLKNVFGIRHAGHRTQDSVSEF